MDSYLFSRYNKKKKGGIDMENRKKSDTQKHRGFSPSKSMRVSESKRSSSSSREKKIERGQAGDHRPPRDVK